jgi:glycerol-1-phosphate dehydrogenase [NAD(P)+]
MTNLFEKIIIKIENNLTKNAHLLINSLGYELDQCLIVSDKKIFNKYRSKFGKDFIKNIDKILILNQPYADQKTSEKIQKHAKKVKLIIAIGSGTINDLCKYSASKLNIKYLIFATAPSMNGYASINASIVINHHKKTVIATLPQAIFIDLEIIKSAPKKMIRAGIADALCIYSCMFDWQLSHLIFNTDFNSKCFEIQQNWLNQLFKNYQKFDLNNSEFLTILSRLLITSGHAMTLANGSYPASQSEHLIAHCLELKYPKLKKILHGQLIAITLATSLNFQQQILTRLDKNDLFLTDKNNNWYKIINNYFAKETAKQCINEYQNKIEKFQPINQINQKLLKDHRIIYQQLNQIYKENKMVIKIFKHFKINQNPKLLAISSAKYDDALNKAKFIRNRITCLDFFK